MFRKVFIIVFLMSFSYICAETNIIIDTTSVTTQTIQKSKEYYVLNIDEIYGSYYTYKYIIESPIVIAAYSESIKSNPEDLSESIVSLNVDNVIKGSTDIVNIEVAFNIDEFEFDEDEMSILFLDKDLNLITKYNISEDLTLKDVIDSIKYIDYKFNTLKTDNMEAYGISDLDNIEIFYKYIGKTANYPFVSLTIMGNGSTKCNFKENDKDYYSDSLIIDTNTVTEIINMYARIDFFNVSTIEIMGDYEISKIYGPVIITNVLNVEEDDDRRDTFSFKTSNNEREIEGVFNFSTIEGYYLQELRILSWKIFNNIKYKERFKDYKDISKKLLKKYMYRFYDDLEAQLVYNEKSFYDIINEIVMDENMKKSVRETGQNILQKLSNTQPE